MEANLRAVLGVNQVVGHYQNTDELPKDVESFANWPLDPFDDQPLKYRKMDENGFLVYSVGTDEIDQGGENLYTYGVMELDAPQDIGFFIRLK